MNFIDYVETNRQSKKTTPNQAIVERWQTRVIAVGQHLNGERGAEAYLSLYGKSIGSAKCVAFARYAEEQGYSEFALGMWKKAFAIDFPGEKIDKVESILLKLDAVTDQRVAQEEQGKVLGDNPHPATPVAGEAPANPFPADMQPGHLATAQPCDAQKPREFYANDDRYWAQAKRDGNKLVVFATPDKVWYQSRSLKVNGAPSAQMDDAFRFAASMIDNFILEGEIYYLDVNGGEHMTGATCLARNVQLGHADIRPRQIFSAFECLYLGNNARMERKWERVGEAELIMRTLAMQAPACFEMLATARSAEEKQALCDKQKAEGREGEVFFLSDLRYVPGKITSGKDPQFDGYVRTKYSVGVQRYRITKVEPSRAEGHAIGGFEIEDTDGKPVGSVGTGYSRSQQVEILRRFTEKPNDTWVLVDAQVKTIFGKLRHARFLGFPEEE